MTRAKAVRLALVNWKGLVYEEFELDEGVTALEGENGAGKTTVMIAAYTVLLPDLTYLRFANVGEASSGGGEAGIWGRLGTQGPAYAWLDIRMPRQRVIVGVHLQRLSRPRLELEPLIIESAPEDIPLERLVMRASGGQLEVPDPKDLSSLALIQGATCVSYGRSKKDYFGRLFDLGITPVRMFTSDERAKVNEMLKTCMMGGISNTLRTGLRDFLFPENTRLADTVRRMEQNLDACRVTRGRAERYQSVEKEIRELYQAGQRAFLCALHGTTVWEDEARKEVVSKEGDAAKARAREKDLAADLERTLAEIAALQEQIEGLGPRIEAARQRADLVQTALGLANKLATQEADLQDRIADLDTARSRFETVERLLGESAGRERRAESRHADAARALGEYQRGFEDLARKVALYRHAAELLRRVLEASGEAHIDPSEFPARLAAVQELARELASAAAGLQLRLEDHEGHRARFERGRTLVERTLGRTATGDDLGESLSELDTLRRRLEAAKEAVPELEQRVGAARAQAGQQAAVRQRGRALGIASSADLTMAIGGAEEEAQALIDGIALLDGQIAELRERLAETGLERRALETMVAPWSQAHADAARLAKGRAPVASQADLLALHGSLSTDLETARRDLRVTGEHLAELKERRRALELSGALPPWVVEARDLVDAELVAEFFDDVPVEQAAVHEAVLGARAAALLVRDPGAAARVIAQSALLQPGQELMLVDSLPTVGSPEVLDEGCVLVPEEAAARLARPSDRPVLGRAAREKAVAALDQDIEATEARESNQDAVVGELGAALALATSLLPRAEHLDQSDPRIRLAELRTAEVDLKAESDRLTAERALRRARGTEVQQSLTSLRSLLSHALLLDPPDHAAEARALEARLSVAKGDARRLTEIGADLREIDTLRSDLMRPPLAVAEVEGLRDRLGQVHAERTGLVPVVQALDELARDPEPLGWAHFIPVLEAKKAIGPAMETELTESEATLERCRAEKKAAQEARDAAHQEASDSEVAWKIARGHRDDTAQHLAETGIEAPSRDLLAEAQARLDQLRGQQKELATRRSVLDVAKGRIDSELQSVRADLDQIEGRLRMARDEHGHRARNLGAFRAAVREASLDFDWLMAQDPGATGSPNLFGEAKARRGVVTALLERQPAAEHLLLQYAAAAEGGSIEHVAAWVALRKDLHQRIPPDISQAPDVLKGLEDLGRAVHRLRRALAEHERDLRTDAKAIGSTIKSHRRRASNKVRELSLALSSVRFGTVKRIELQTRPVAVMNDLLAALAGEVDLFRADLPIEQALEQAFESIGGGKVQASNLLDYRRYFEVKVQVEKTDGERDGARGDQMSTGEAIGVGAAIMMIVLRAWEDDSGNIRKKRSFGSMRLLFLDEATRLGRASQEVLFDLCRALELQLLIAAPVVDRVEGATTYTLVRAEDGSRVDIHGRRVVARAVEG